MLPFAFAFSGSLLWVLRAPSSKQFRDAASVKSAGRLFAEFLIPAQGQIGVKSAARRTFPGTLTTSSG